MFNAIAANFGGYSLKYFSQIDNTMHLIRLEDQDGNGPYTSDDSPAKAGDWNLFDLEGRHPRPKDDEKLVTSFLTRKNVAFKASLFLYGFTSIPQLRRWFYRDDILQAFHDSDFMLATYKGEIFEGFTQSVVLKGTEERIKGESIENFLL